MEKSDGVGLAAPQVGLSIRLLVVGLDVLSEDYPEYAGFKRAYLNAHIVETEEETVSMEEGCLSFARHQRTCASSEARTCAMDGSRFHAT